VPGPAAKHVRARGVSTLPGGTQSPRAEHDADPGLHPAAAVIGAAAACGAIGLLIGLAAGGLVPGITGWESGAWRVPAMNAACGAVLGAVIAAAMYRVAVRHRRADLNLSPGQPAQTKPTVD